MFLNLGELFSISKLRNVLFRSRQLMISSINLFKKEVAIVWKDKTTTIIKASTLRRLCPCALCSGEKDVFGNQYGGIDVPDNKEVSIVKFEQIGYYGLQFYFSDGHKDGIYTLTFLKNYNET